ncbi:MAG: hypothetical protein AB4080_25120, partial [Trichodesmium sp.]
MWIVRDSNDMRLSPLLVAFFAASTTFGLSKSANAQILENDIDTNFVSLSISSRTQFSKLSSTKSFIDLGSSFPSAKLFGITKNPEVDLDFYGLLKITAMTKPLIFSKNSKNIDSKQSSVLNKEFGQFLGLNVFENIEIPQVTLINKISEVKAEPLANKQFTPSVSGEETLEDNPEISESIALGKSGEIKAEPLANKQFTPSVSGEETLEDNPEISESIALGKSGEIKADPLSNK